LQSVNVSVIIPFHNEIRGINHTLAQLDNQSVQPQEILFVDSNSSDETRMAIQKWIELRKKDVSVISILDATESGPGGARNQGLRAAQCKYVAFMDCGLTFEADWLERFFIVLECQPQLTWISGVCRLEGIGLVDQCAVANTYGYRRLRPTLPTSMLHTVLIARIGLFRTVRAGEDLEWIARCSASGMTRLIDSTTEIGYEGTNYASSLLSLVRKSYDYSRHIFQAGRRRAGLVVLIAPLLSTLALFMDLLSVLELSLVYSLLRIFILFAKNGVQALRYLRPDRLFMTAVTSLSIDLGRTLGVVRSAVSLVTARRET
jgi:glycosyltransferase involved in cell wall biosynthesis